MTAHKNPKLTSKKTTPKPTISACVELVLGQAQHLIQAVLDGLHTAATRGGTGMGDRTLQNPVILQVVLQLHSEQEAIQAAFSDNLRRFLYAGLGAKAQAQAVVRFEDLRLFEEDQLGDSIEIARAQQAVTISVERSLAQLDGLVSSLMGWITVQPQINPFRPEVFVHALREGFHLHLPKDDDIRGIVISAAAARLGPLLDKLYHKLSDWLMLQGVEAAGAGANASSLGAAAVSNKVAKSVLTLDKLRRLLTGEKSSERAHERSGQGGPGFMHTMPLSLEALEDSDLVETMVDRYSQQAQEDPGSLQRKQEQARQALASGMPLGSVLGAEVTRLMLEMILQDARLLPQVKKTLAVLEPALLRLTTVDLRFFSEDQHPARRFLAVVTERGLGFNQVQEAGFAPFLQSLEKSTAHIVAQDAKITQPEQLTLVFEAVLRQLLTLWERADSGARARQEDIEKAILQAEARNLRAQKWAVDFHAQTTNTRTPEVAIDFLVGVWSQVVAKAQDAEIAGAAVQTAVTLVPDLIWSAQPALARKNRPRLVALIPNMLQTLRQGLHSLDYPPERANVFFETLLKLHEEALEVAHSSKQAQLYHAQARDEDSGDSRWGASSVMHEYTEDAPAVEVLIDYSAEEARLKSLTGGGDIRAAQEKKRATNPNNESSPLEALQLGIGAWIELQLKDQWVRAQMKWQSPRQHIFVFITSAGIAHSLSQESLENLLSEGKIRLVSNGSLVTGALDAVADAALQNSAGRP